MATRKSPTHTLPTPVPKKSRAVLRRIEPGYNEFCTQCGKHIKYSAIPRVYWVICNVYKSGKWQRVEHYHPGCYVLAGEPHGEPKS